MTEGRGGHSVIHGHVDKKQKKWIFLEDGIVTHRTHALDVVASQSTKDSSTTPQQKHSIFSKFPFLSTKLTNQKKTAHHKYSPLPFSLLLNKLSRISLSLSLSLIVVVWPTTGLSLSRIKTQEEEEEERERYRKQNFYFCRGLRTTCWLRLNLRNPNECRILRTYVLPTRKTFSGPNSREEGARNNNNSDDCRTPRNLSYNILCIFLFLPTRQDDERTHDGRHKK